MVEIGVRVWVVRNRGKCELRDFDERKRVDLVVFVVVDESRRERVCVIMGIENERNGVEREKEEENHYSKVSTTIARSTAAVTTR